MTAVHLVTTGGPEDGRGHLSRTVAMAEALTIASARVSLEMIRGTPTASQADRLMVAGLEMLEPRGLAGKDRRLGPNP